MSNFLINITNDIKKNKVPIILVDVSGSTNTMFLSESKLIVRDYEFKLAVNYCIRNDINVANLICWSSQAILFENQDMNNISEIHNKYKNIISGTHLMSGLSQIKESFFAENTMTDIVIITDGEIDDSGNELSKKFKELSKYNINIQIIAVEPNSFDYYTANCSVGNRLYSLIRNNGMTRLVNRFSLYNQKETEFVNLFNPIIPEGFIPFQDKMFKRSDFTNFVTHLISIVNEMNKTDKVKYLKLAHELSLSLYHIIKNKSYSEQMTTTDFFSNLFKDLEFYTEIRKLLIDEVNNHISGKSSTFTELRKNKYADVENKNLSLMNDTFDSISDKSQVLENLFKYSFLMKTDKLYVLKTTSELTDINMDKICYKQSGVRLNNYKIPIMFYPSDSNKEKQSNALQWLLINYSRVLNCSPSNDFIYFYFLIDAFIVNMSNSDDENIKELYNSYVKIILNSKKDEKTIINLANENLFVKVPYNILQDCAKYGRFNIKPLTLLYIIVNHFIVPHINSDKKELFLQNLRNYCENEVKMDMDAETVDWNIVANLIEHDQLILVESNDKELYVMPKHKFHNLDLECIGKLVNSTDNYCTLCESTQPVVALPIVNSIELIILAYSKQFYFDLNKHVNLGMLDGQKKGDMLRIPDTFIQDYDSFELKNITIIDPTSSAKLRINNHTQFNDVVKQKYPFITTLNMNNVALCGGFVRSILLKQQMKDFDFFFYGLPKDDYSKRFRELSEDLVNSIRKIDPSLKFGMFFKPLFNVFEIVCFEDPSNTINEDFTLDNFDKYKFESLRKYDRDHTAKNDKCYFEDNDEKGIKMRYRFQFILCRYDSIFDILHSFDMFPSKVAYDGNQVYFTEKSLIAYQFMINEICYYGGSDLFKHRLSKYFKYGFSIVFPPNDRKWYTRNLDNKYNSTIVSSKYNENIGPLSFKVRNVVNNMIYINHGSNYEMQLERNEQLEKAALETSKALYISSLFCSFVSFLRYVKINSINYVFPQYHKETDKVKLPFNDNHFAFKSNIISIEFLDKIGSVYSHTKWFPKFVDSLLLTNYQNVYVDEEDEEEEVIY